MAHHLVIVESSAKARTLGRLLGRDFQVRASLGELKAWPTAGLGVDTDRGFATEFRVLPARRRLLAALQEAAAEAASVLLAFDPDAAGESLARQLALELVPASRQGCVRRVLCRELTPQAVTVAFRSPRDLDAWKADSCEARRIVDRLLARALFPLFGPPLQPAANHGRVFAVALRLLRDREQEVLAWVAPHEPVVSLARREVRRRPPPPLVTSTLLQEAFGALGFGPKKTLSIAERLYDGGALGADDAVGLISFPLTDGPQTIRPTEIERSPEQLVGLLGSAELALYRLVFERIVASQPAPTAHDETTGQIDACVPGEAAEPPERFTETSLLSELERLGIARPSMGAALLAALDARDCIRKEKGRLRPTKLGSALGEWLQRHVPELVGGPGAAALEARLAAIETGQATLGGVLEAFWRGLQPALASVAPLAGTRAAQASSGSPGRRPSVVATGRGPLGRCPDCGGALARRAGRYGPFVSCSRFPACRYRERETATAVGVSCPRCNDGQVVERAAKGSVFYGCSRYPACRFTSRDRLVPESCPECGRAYMLEKETRREGRIVFCGNESCRFERRGSRARPAQAGAGRDQGATRPAILEGDGPSRDDRRRRPRRL